MSTRTRKPTGIEVRHARDCATNDGGDCTCEPSIRAWVYDRRAKAKLRQTFSGKGALAAAKAWRADAMGDVRRGTRQATPSPTVREAADELVAGMESGLIRNRSGDPYKPSVIRGYRRALRDRIVPAIGAMKLSDVRRRDVQRLADELLAPDDDGKVLDPSSVRNALMPLRVIFRRALTRGDAVLNPVDGVELPAVRGRRERVASPTEMAALIDALPERDRALWGTAAYAGLRLGELRGLKWDDVDLAANVIYVRRGWDPREGEIAPKSRAGERRTPIVPALRSLLLRHQLLTGRRAGFVFGRRHDEPFTATSVAGRAATAWKRAGLTKITLHECRHTCVSMMHAAGISLEAIGDYIGHSSAYMTDRYRHLLEGERERHAKMLDAYLEQATRGPVVGQLGHSSSGFQRS